MYQRARTVGYKQLSGGALSGTRSARQIRETWADLERKRKGHTRFRPDIPYDVPSYYSEKDRRRGKTHPGQYLLEEARPSYAGSTGRSPSKGNSAAAGVA